jgi:hypothetical protein
MTAHFSARFHEPKKIADFGRRRANGGPQRKPQRKNAAAVTPARINVTRLVPSSGSITNASRQRQRQQGNEHASQHDHSRDKQMDRRQTADRDRHRRRSANRQQRAAGQPHVASHRFRPSTDSLFQPGLLPEQHRHHQHGRRQRVDHSQSKGPPPGTPPVHQPKLNAIAAAARTIWTIASDVSTSWFPNAARNWCDELASASGFSRKPAKAVNPSASGSRVHCRDRPSPTAAWTTAKLPKPSTSHEKGFPAGNHTES